MNYEPNLKSHEVLDVSQSEITRLQWQKDHWNLLVHKNCYNVRVTDKVLGLDTRYNYISTFPCKMPIHLPAVQSSHTNLIS
jgi:hypothetical protein